MAFPTIPWGRPLRGNFYGSSFAIRASIRMGLSSLQKRVWLDRLGLLVAMDILPRLNGGVCGIFLVMGAKEEFIEKLEGKGEGAVRGEVATYTTSHKRWANAWLAIKDHERLLRIEALDAENLSLAKSANDLASINNLITRKALTIATIAAIAAIIAAAAAIAAAAVTVISFSSN